VKTISGEIKTSS